MPSVDFEVEGAHKAAAHLLELGERGSDVRRPAERIKQVYTRSNQRRFAGAGHWPPLAPATVQRKARAGGDQRIERRTGELYRSLTSMHGANQEDRRDKQELRFGTTVPYAGFQYGNGHQPARPLIRLSPADRRDVTRLIAAWVVEERS